MGIKLLRKLCGNDTSIEFIGPAKCVLYETVPAQDAGTDKGGGRFDYPK